MTKDEALHMALEALEDYEYGKETTAYLAKVERVTAAIREVLAQPEQCQCPACKVTPHASDCSVHNEPAWPNGPCDCGAQSERKPLTDEEIDVLVMDSDGLPNSHLEFARAIEAAHGITGESK